MDPKPLIADSVCRACWHDAHGIPCGAVDPPDINPHGHACPCDEYVDLEAESRIMVIPSELAEG